MWWTAINRVLNEDLPAIRCLLQSIEIECDQIVKEVAFHLAAEDIYLASEDVESVSIAAWRTWTGW